MMADQIYDTTAPYVISPVFGTVDALFASITREGKTVTIKGYPTEADRLDGINLIYHETKEFINA